MTQIERDILELKIKYSKFKGAPTADQILRVVEYAEGKLYKYGDISNNESNNT